MTEEEYLRIIEIPEVKTIFTPRTQNAIWNGIWQYLRLKHTGKKYISQVSGDEWRRIIETDKVDPNEAESICNNLGTLLDFILNNKLDVREFRGIGKKGYKEFLGILQNHSR